MTAPTPAQIRSWARDQGFSMPDRGPLSAEVKAAYAKAHRAAARTANPRRPAPAARSTRTPAASSKARGVKTVQEPVERHPTAVAVPPEPETDTVLARTVAEMSKRIAELERTVAELHAAQARPTSRFRRRSA